MAILEKKSVGTAFSKVLVTGSDVGFGHGGEGLMLASGCEDSGDGSAKVWKV